MEIVLFLTGSLSLLIWLYLVFLRGGFWRADQRLNADPPEPRNWPGVAAVIAASDDVDAIEECLSDILEQAYTGPFHIILVDDHSCDGVPEAALRAMRAAGAAKRLSVLTSKARPAGWSRKAWALAQAHEHVAANLRAIRYLWLTEPWVQHGYYSLHNLVAKAEHARCGIVSLLPLSICESAWDRLLAPAFVFFFQAFHPLRRVNDPQNVSAAASAGCVLVNIDTLKSAGGFAAFKDAPTLESALAAKAKTMARSEGRGIWLGLGEGSTSVRLGDDWKALRDLTLSIVEPQLRASPMRLAASIIAMALACLAPPIVFLWALVAGFFLDIDQFLVTFLAILVACAAWAGMSFAAWPTFDLHGQEEWRTLVLPLAGVAYLLLTIALMPRLVGTGRWPAKKAVVNAKDARRQRTGTTKEEPRLKDPSQAIREPTSGHALRHWIARS